MGGGIFFEERRAGLMGLAVALSSFAALMMLGVGSGLVAPGYENDMGMSIITNKDLGSGFSSIAFASIGHVQTLISWNGTQVKEDVRRQAGDCGRARDQHAMFLLCAMNFIFLMIYMSAKRLTPQEPLYKQLALVTVVGAMLCSASPVLIYRHYCVAPMGATTEMGNGVYAIGAALVAILLCGLLHICLPTFAMENMGTQEDDDDDDDDDEVAEMASEIRGVPKRKRGPLPGAINSDSDSDANSSIDAESSIGSEGSSLDSENQ